VKDLVAKSVIEVLATRSFTVLRMTNAHVSAFFRFLIHLLGRMTNSYHAPSSEFSTHCRNVTLSPIVKQTAQPIRRTNRVLDSCFLPLPSVS